MLSLFLQNFNKTNSKQIQNIDFLKTNAPYNSIVNKNKTNYGGFKNVKQRNQISRKN